MNLSHTRIRRPTDFTDKHGFSKKAGIPLQGNADISRESVAIRFIREIRGSSFPLLGFAACCVAFGSLPLRAAEAAPATWPTWRGDSAMTGIAAETLAMPLKPAWKFQATKPIKATAVSDGKLAFFGDGKGTFFALKLEDGTKAWEFAAKDLIEGSALLVGKDVIFGSVDGVVHCLEAETGKLRWEFTTEAEIRGAANVFERPGQEPLILIGSYDNRLYALKASDGSKVWVVETGNYVNGTPSLVDGVTAFGGCDGFLYFVNGADGKEKGKVEVSNPIASTVAARNGIAVVGHYGNEVVAVEAATLKVKWTYKDRDFPFFSSPAITADGLVFAGDRGKRLHCLSLADGEEKWAFRTQGRVDSSPVVTGSNVVFGSDDGKVYAVGTGDGKAVWSYEIGQPVQSSPCIAGGRLLIGADDGVLYAFSPSAASPSAAETPDKKE
ncbi:MAG: PQQ-binding-like beta-propeller repeat protein [Verrucomicrobiota bacterium]